MKKPVLFISLLVILIVGLSLVQITVSNGLSTTGVSLAKTQDQIDAYKKENAILQEKLLNESSLTQIASAAAEMGFIEAKNDFYLGTPLPVAINQ